MYHVRYIYMIYIYSVYYIYTSCNLPLIKATQAAKRGLSNIVRVNCLHNVQGWVSDCGGSHWLPNDAVIQKKKKNRLFTILILSFL